MSEARVPVVGDVWRLSRWHYESNEVTIVSLGARGGCLCKAHVRCLMSSGNEDGWCEGTFAKVATFVRSASPPKERDWSAWLPPRPLPDTGPKVFKVRQVWAAHAGGAVGSVVFRVLRAGGGAGNVQVLAASKGGYYSHDGNSCCASDGMGGVGVLVADVGCEPTPPEVLYGAAPPVAPPVVEGPRVPGFGTQPYVKPACPCGGYGRNRLIVHLYDCQFLAARNGKPHLNEIGPGIAAKFAPKPCPLVGCGHRRCIAASDQPWQPSLHPDELIGRDV